MTYPVSIRVNKHFKGSRQKKKLRILRTCPRRWVGTGYWFQNLISFTYEIRTNMKGGWVSNTDVIIS